MIETTSPGSPLEPAPELAWSPNFALSCLQLLNTPSAGRGVFTSEAIPAGTHLLTSSDLSTFCLAYDRGQRWKLRDAALGASWCGDACEVAWRASMGGPSPEVAQALEAVEGLISRAKGHRSPEIDQMMLEASDAAPSAADIRKAWVEAEAQGDDILAARGFDCSSAYPANDHEARRGHSGRGRKAMRARLAEPPEPSVLYYLLSGVLLRSSSIEAWSNVLRLSAATKPYSCRAVLDQHICSYLQLLALLPPALLVGCTPGVMLAAADRDAHNAFGLRSLDDGGAEVFGYGVWPSASYWNHSCAPNVSKRRQGRSWTFAAARPIGPGEQLCISYLGGDEQILDTSARRTRLRDNWHFDCACQKCLEESAGLASVGPH